MVIIREQSGVLLKKAGLLPLKGLFYVLNNNIKFYFLDFLSQDILKEIDRV